MLTEQTTASRRALRHLGYLILAGVLILAGPAEPAHADETVPDAPQLSAGYVSGTTSIVFTWKAPKSDGGSAVTGYLAEYSPYGYSTWTDINVGPAATSLTLAQNSLTYSSAFALRLAAINAIGQSEWATLTFHSLDKPGTPTITAVNVDYEALDIRVDPGVKPTTSTTVTATPGAHTCVLAPPQTRCLMDGLTGGTKYTLTAISVNPAGTSKTSAGVTATPIGRPTAVRNLKAKVVKKNGKRRIVLTWTKPANLRAGVLSGVTVVDQRNHTSRFYPWRTKITITKVKRHHKYRFLITPVTHATGDSYRYYGPEKAVTITVH
ncbi:fibronectin type III domain-containing protein [Actinoplanes derwentensis]|uniref:Fibronectin type III domain-containing protein n=1 Tax=Actinoplanes derwentensis TaxID=113562 RepID=A0A1H2CRC1_9ACTN|nr:fibronectin type III domain-containing protein [Actinoplanes derwentensis]GID89859.1 hypothetical protein Ade03nite_87830 [Actinoplanes derwentensis]SDT73003.1 Fibronectin type III domain-containing protein [Actinoplanes derwentensis]